MHTDLKNMFTATRLTVAGRVTEATSFLRRLLAHPGGHSASDGASSGGSSPEGIGPASDEALGAGGARLRTPFREILDAGAALRFKTPGDRPYAPVVPATEVVPPEPGQFLAATFGNSAGTRPYKIYVPDGYHGQAVPLVVMLHGCTQAPDDFAVGTRMNLVADEQTFIVAYPGQTSAANGSKCWNWFAEEHQHRGRGEPSLVAGITRSVMTEYAIDPDRVYVAGLSAGGAAAAVLAAAYPDLYAAIGVHSGLACGAARDVTSALAAMKGRRSEWTFRPVRAEARAAAPIVPMIVFHGDADTTVHPVNSDHIVAASIGATSFEKILIKGSAPGGRTYTRMLYADASGRAALEQWTIHGSGHAWTGGDPRGSYTDPSGPDATREMIRFFMEHPRALR